MATLTPINIVGSILMVIFGYEGTQGKMDMTFFFLLRLSIKAKFVSYSNKKYLIRTDQMSQFCSGHLAMNS